MAETFYSALGVESGADADAIRQAYRDRVKQRHPDVSDDPGAPREFKRLTTARDVLTDESERERYDRLGHATYVDRHLETNVWAVEDRGGPTGSGRSTARRRSPSRAGTTRTARDGETSARGSEAHERHRATHADGYDRSAWLGEDWEGPRDANQTQSGARERRAAASSGHSAGTTAEAGWQHASDAYRYQPSSVPTDPATAGTRARRLVGSVGPWLVVHAIFLGTAIATAWYTYATTSVATRFSLPAMAFGVLLVGLVVFLSVLHVVSLLYG